MLRLNNHSKTFFKTVSSSFKVFLILLSTFVFINVKAQTITAIDDALIILDSVNENIVVRGMNLQRLRLINGKDTFLTQPYTNKYYNAPTSDTAYVFPLVSRLQYKIYRVIGIGNNNQLTTQFNLIRFYKSKTSLYLEAWGDNSSSQLNYPNTLPLDRITDIYLGRTFVIALLDDGTLRGWGDNSVGQLNFPVGLNNIVALAPGVDHCLALSKTGSVIAWGNNGSNQASVPSAARNNVVGVAAGEFSSLAILANGQIVLWGDNTYGETTPPANINQPVLQANLAKFEGYGLLSDSTLTYWGNNINIFNLTPPPNTVSKLTSVYTGIHHIIGQRPDGSLVAWGDNTQGQLNIPSAAQNPTSYFAGNLHNIAVARDNTLITWGDNSFGQNTANYYRREVNEIYGLGGHANYNYIFRKFQINLTINGPSGNIVKFYGFNRNQNVRLNLTDDVRGYIIDSVFVDNVYNQSLSTNFNPVFAFDSLSGDHSIRLRTRILNYSLQTMAIPANGGTITANNNNLNYFNPLRVTYAPNTGYQIYGVFVNGQAISLDSVNGYTFTNINSNLNVTAYFTLTTSSGLVQVRTLTHNVVENDSIRIYGRNIDSVSIGINNQWVNLNFTKTALSLDTLYTVVFPINLIQRNRIYPLLLKNKQGVASSVSYLVRSYSNNLSSYWTGEGKNTINQAQISVSQANSFLKIIPGPTYSVGIRPDYTLTQIGQASSNGVPTNLSLIPAILDVFLGNNYGLMLRGNGTIAGWGSDNLVSTIPSSLTNPNTAHVVFITANTKTALALRADGSIVGWGDTSKGLLNIPNITGAKAIAINEFNGFYINSQDSLVRWGAGSDNNYPQPIVPSPLNLDSISQIYASNSRVIALKQNGNLLAWGSNNQGQSSPPANLNSLIQVGVSSNFTDNVFFDLALSNNNSVVAWGNYPFSTTNFNNVQAISLSPLSTTFFLYKTLNISTQVSVGGSFSPISNIPYNGSYTVSFSPILGYAVDSVFVNGRFLYRLNSTGVNTYTFNNITGDSSIRVTFLPFTAVISTSAVNGTLTSSSNSASYNGRVVLTLTPNTGYQLDSFFINEIYIRSALDSGNRYTVNNILQNIQAFARFRLRTFLISTTILNSTITPSTVVGYNSSLTINWTPSSNPNFVLDSVIVDGVFQPNYTNTTQTSYTFNNVTANHNIRVTYHPRLYTITTQVVNGFISPSTTINYSSSYRVTYSQAGLNFVLSRIYVNGVYNPNLTIDSISRFTFSNLNSNVTIRVEYSFLSTGSPYYILRNKFFDLGTEFALTGRNITEIQLVDFNNTRYVFKRTDNTLKTLVVGSQNNTTDTIYSFTLPNRTITVRPGVYQLITRGFNGSTSPLQLIRLMDPGISKAGYFSNGDGPAVPSYIGDAAMLAPVQYDNNSFTGQSKYGFALQTDGTVVGWSSNGSRLNLPFLFSNDIVDLSFGNGTDNVVRGAWGIALRSDGTVAYWNSGDNSVYNNQLGGNVQGGSLSNIVSIKAGHSVGYYINSSGNVITTGNGGGAPYFDVSTNKPASGLRTKLISENYLGFLRLDSGETIYMPSNAYNPLFFANRNWGSTIDYTFPNGGGTYKLQDNFYNPNIFFYTNRIYGNNGYYDVGQVTWILNYIDINKFNDGGLFNSYDLNTSLASNNSYYIPSRSNSNNSRATNNNTAVDIASGFAHHAILLDNGTVTLGGFNFLVPSNVTNSINNRPSYAFNNSSATTNVLDIASTWASVIFRNQNKTLSKVSILSTYTGNGVPLPTRNDSILGVFANGIVDHYYYARKIRITTSMNLSVGGISLSPTTNNVNARTNYRITYSHPGYSISSIVINGVTYNNLQDSTSGYTFYNIQSDINFNINFAPNQYNINVQVLNGSLVGPDNFQYATGNPASSITFNPNSATDTLVGIYINDVYSPDLTNLINQNKSYSFQVANIVNNTNFRIVFSPKNQPVILQNTLNRSVLYAGDNLTVHGSQIRNVLLTSNNKDYITINAPQIMRSGISFNDSLYNFTIPQNTADQIYTVWVQDYASNSVIAGIVKVLASRDILSIAAIVPLNTPAPLVPTSNNVVAIANGENHALALLNNGTVVAWGNNTYGQTTLPNSSINSNVVAIAAGNGTSVILRNDGTVYAWGNNTFNQLSVNGLTNVKRIICGQDYIAVLLNSGTVRVFGSNNYGILNALNTLPNFTEISAGRFHACGTGADSVVTCWGNNTYTQLFIFPPSTKVVSQSSGDVNNLALLPNQTAVFWGDNSNNQFDVNNTDRLSAVYGGRGHASYKRLDNSIFILGRDYNNNSLNLPNPLPINVYTVADGPLSQNIYILYNNLKLITTAVNELGSISSSTTVNNGQNYRVTYQPVPGAIIDSIYINNIYDSTVTTDSLNGYTFRNILTNVAIRVVYRFTQLQISTQITNGTITPTTNVNYLSNFNVIFNPNIGYGLVGLYVDGNVTSPTTINSYSFNNIDRNHSVSVVNLLSNFIINTSVTNGTITNSTSTNYFSPVQIQFVPNPNSKLEAIFINGVYDSNATRDSINHYTFSNVLSNQYIEVRYVQNTYSISSSVNNQTLGIISPLGNTRVTSSDNTVYTFTPYSGNKLDSVLIKGQKVSVVGNSYTVSNVNSNDTIVAYFSPILRPSAPQNVIATGGNSQIQVNFNPPLNNGGAPILEYQIKTYYLTQNGLGARLDSLYKIDTVLQSPDIVSNLKLDGYYRVVVSAINSVGSGDSASTDSININQNYINFYTKAINGSISQLNSVVANTAQTITFSPNQGYILDSFFINDVYNNNITTSPYNFTPTTNTTILVKFKPIQYNQIGIINNANFGTISATSPQFNINTTDTVTINANYGYRIVSIVRNTSENILINSPTLALYSYSFSNRNSNDSVSVVFDTLKSTIVTQSRGNGTITPTVMNANLFTPTTINFTPNPGSIVDSLVVNSVLILNSANLTSYTFTTLNGNRDSIYVSFRTSNVSITTSALNGAITPSFTANPSGANVVSYLPVNGYTIDSIFINGIYNTMATQNNPLNYTFNNPVTNQSIFVKFKTQVSTITPIIDAGGRISAPYTTSYFDLSQVTYSLLAGYVVDSIFINDVYNLMASNSLATIITLRNIDRNTVVRVKTRLNKYTIFGTISGGGYFDVNKNDTLIVNNLNYYSQPYRVEYQAEVGSGNRVDTVLVDGVLYNDSTEGYTFTDFTRNHTIFVLFEPATFTITTEVVGGVISNDTVVNRHATATITYQPNSPTYILDSIYIDGEYDPIATSNPNYRNSYTFNDFGLGIIENHSIRVVFRLPKYTITTSLTTNNQINVGGIINQPLSNLVDSGASVNYQVTANSGYSIDTIYINNRIVFVPTTLTSVYNFTLNNIRGDSNINIKFKTQTYNITVYVNDTNAIKLVPNTRSITGLAYNSYQSFKINIQNGYNVDSIIVDGVKVAYPAFDLYEFFFIKANHTISFYGSRGIYKIFTTAGNNGSILSTTDSFKVLKGGNISVIARPNINYIVDSVWINGKLQNLGSYVGGDYIKTFSNVTGDSSIKVTFKQNVVDLNQSNFIVRAVNSLCPGFSNGSISLTSTNNRPFIIAIRGPVSYSKNDTFSQSYSINNLAPGNYSIIITISGIDTNNYRVSYSIPITEPKAVSSSSSVNPINKEIELSLNGGNNYIISINGKLWETQKSDIKLPLQVGMNTVIVKTDQTCQDSTIEYILVSESVDAYPNPAINYINFNIGGTDENAHFEIISDQGVKMFSDLRNIDNNRNVRFNLENYPNGVYIVKIKGSTILATIKFVKTNN